MSNPARKSSGPVDVAVRVDVQLGAVQQRHVVVRLERAEALALREDLVVGHPLHRQVRRVVGHGVVRVAQRRGRVQHLLQRREPVRQVGVGVQVAPEVLELQDLGQLAGQRGLDLTAILPERRLDVRQPEALVDLRLGLGGEEVSRLRVEQPVLVELQPGADRHLADPDVVRLRAGEVDHRGAPHLLGNDAEVDLQSVVGQDRRLRVAVGDHPRRRGQPDERVHDRRGAVARDEEVDVADRLSHPAERSGERRPADLLHGGELGQERLSDVERRVHQDAPTGIGELLQTTEDVLLGLPPEPLEAGDAFVLDRRHQLGDGRDPQLLVEHHGLLGTEARDRHQLAHPGRDLRAQRLQVGERPGLEQLDDLLPDRLADVRDLQDALQVERRDVGVVATHRAGRLLVGARLVRIVRQDRQQVRELEERLLDVVVRARHAGLRPGRTGRAGAPSACGAGSRPGPTRRNAGRR